MQRYSQMLAEAYADAGAEVRVLRPTGVLSARVRSATVAKLVMYAEELILFPVRVRLDRRATDRYHVADHSDSPWLLPIGLRSPAVVTCHDLTAVRAALGEIGEHRPGPTGRLQQRMIRAGLRRAELVLTVSRATAADVTRVLPGVRTAILPNPLAPSLRARVDDAVRSDHQPYVLMVGNDAWYKRRPLGLRMWRELCRVDPDLRLAVVGEPFSPTEIRLAGLTADWDRLSEAVDLAGGLDDDALAGLYRGAEALLQPSAYEGFCWPVVEANACGTVAICADIPVLREVGPDNLFQKDTDDLGALHELWPQRLETDRIHAVESHARTVFTWPAFVEALSDSIHATRARGGRDEAGRVS